MKKNNTEQAGSASKIVGAAIAGVLAGAAAVALTDKKKRDALLKKVGEMKDIGEQKLAGTRMKAEKETSKARRKLAENIDKAKKVVEPKNT